MKRVGLLFVLSFVLVFPLSQASALDTDLYAVTSGDVAPNIMIMFDNSISMNENISGVLYDPGTIYPFVVTDYSRRRFITKQEGEIGTSIGILLASLVVALCRQLYRVMGFIPEKLGFLPLSVEQPTMLI